MWDIIIQNTFLLFSNLEYDVQNLLLGLSDSVAIQHHDTHRKIAFITDANIQGLKEKKNNGNKNKAFKLHVQ